MRPSLYHLSYAAPDRPHDWMRKQMHKSQRYLVVKDKQLPE